ncbi:MAG TPA: hypothetical protein VGD21_01215 [Lysobacter sp.]
MNAGMQAHPSDKLEQVERGVLALALVAALLWALLTGDSGPIVL